MTRAVAPFRSILRSLCLAITSKETQVWSLGRVVDAGKVPRSLTPSSAAFSPGHRLFRQLTKPCAPLAIIIERLNYFSYRGMQRIPIHNRNGADSLKHQCRLSVLLTNFQKAVPIGIHCPRITRLFHWRRAASVTVVILAPSF